jgi:hypothetical protein
MSYRLQVTIADDAADELERRADTAGQPVSRVAATLITLALGTTAGPTHAAASTRPRAIDRPASQPASWIEPVDRAARRHWRAELWAAVLALHNRYPKELARLEASWWQNTARIEQLAALDAWRLAIDQASGDPREELAFHHQHRHRHLPPRTTTPRMARAYTAVERPIRHAVSTLPRLTRDEVLDARQVADLLHLPASTVLDYARREILPAHKLGRRWIFLRDEIELRLRDAPGRLAEVTDWNRDALQPNGLSERSTHAVHAARSGCGEQAQLFSE